MNVSGTLSGARISFFFFFTLRVSAVVTALTLKEPQRLLRSAATTQTTETCVKSRRGSLARGSLFILFYFFESPELAQD